MINNLSDVLTFKFPNCQFACGETIDSIQWHDERPQPTLLELQEADAEYTIYLETLNHNKLIYTEILKLETEITPRRFREAILNGDNSFIESIDSQIEELRGTLI